MTFTDNLPDVPNWLAWIATIGGIAAFTYPPLAWLWRNHLADRWAARSRTAARRKAVEIGTYFKSQIAPHRHDTMRLLERCNTAARLWTTSMALLTAGVLLLVCYEAITDNDLVHLHPIGNHLAVFGIVFLLPGLALFVASGVIRDRSIVPFRHYAHYSGQLLYRARSLLEKSGADEADIHDLLKNWFGTIDATDFFD